LLSLFDASFRDDKMVRTMQVNVISHFWTAKAFVPTMLKRNTGHVVTIASAAGLTGVAGLADYCASKFGAVGFADSVHYEMRKRGANVHSTVVCPYYIKTGMFEGVQTKMSLLLPLLEPQYAADMIFEAVRDKQRLLCMPRLVYLSPLFKVLPSGVADALCDFLGTNQTMDHFVGRK
jgi:all-trans-retinol dehydrogenase (NAD+)